MVLALAVMFCLRKQAPFGPFSPFYKTMAGPKNPVLFHRLGGRPRLAFLPTISKMVARRFGHFLSGFADHRAC
jgi:hypothetical protein